MGCLKANNPDRCTSFLLAKNYKPTWTKSYNYFCTRRKSLFHINGDKQARILTQDKLHPTQTPALDIMNYKFLTTETNLKAFYIFRRF